MTNMQEMLGSMGEGEEGIATNVDIVFCYRRNKKYADNYRHGKRVCAFFPGQVI